MSDSHPSLDGLLSRTTDRTPGNLAVVDAHGNSLTYAALSERAKGLARFLADNGVGPGDRVGLCVPKSIESVVGLFATLSARAAYVPVDASAPSQRCAFVFSDCTVKAILVHTSVLEALSDALPDRSIAAVKDLESLGMGTQVKLMCLAWPEAAIAANDNNLTEGLAYILYTSGSTGNPKGVIHTHASALAFVDWCTQEITPEANDRFSSHAPFHFDLSIFDLYVPVKHGGAIVLIDEDLGKQPRKLVPFIAEMGITVWYSTPSILRLLIEFGGLDEQPASALRTVVFAGEVFPMKYLRQLQTVWPKPDYYNFYGPTETNVCTYFKVPRADDSDAEELPALPIGWPCSLDRARVTDNSGNEVPEGADGELVIAGGSVMQGYWNLPDRNATAFHSGANGERWYRTGDIVREDPRLGYFYLGRRDRMVKRRGYRVELGEIEAALYKHEDISEAAVLAADDPEAGVSITAFVAWTGTAKPSLIALKRFSGENLPAYMVPDRFSFLEELPKTSTDKIDYQRLKETL